MSESAPPKAEANSSGWQDWANRTTAILAVIAALSSGRWGASNLQAILEQGKVNDTWAYFQSDSIKAHAAGQTSALAKAIKDSPAVKDSHAAPSTEPTAGSAKLTPLDALVKRMDEEARREEQKKAREEEHARKYEQSRDRMVERGFWFEISFAALQLGVVLCTIATGAKRKGPWFLAMAFGFIGFVIMVNGFHPVIHAPRSWYQGTSEDMGYHVTNKNPGL